MGLRTAVATVAVVLLASTPLAAQEPLELPADTATADGPEDATAGPEDEYWSWRGQAWMQALRRQVESFEGATGLNVDWRYTGQVFKNTHGGLQPGPVRYRAGTDLTLELETNKPGWWEDWEGGRFYVYGFNVHGRSLTATELGDFQFYSNFETLPKGDVVTQIGEAWYEQLWFEGQLRTKVGLQDGNVDFARGDVAYEFINSAFNTIAPTPVPTWPLQTFGGFAEWTFEDGIQWKGGVYDGRHVGAHYFLPTRDDDGTVIALTEIVLPLEFGSDPLRGAVRLGAWYHTGKYDAITIDEPRVLTGNTGLYVTGEQKLWRENRTDGDVQGLSAFLQYGWGLDDRNPANQNLSGGLLYHGLVRERDEDVLGLGVTAIWFGRPTRQVDGRTDETAIELFYRARLSPHVQLQPDLQFIANPGGDGTDALAVGVQFVLAL